MSVFDVAVAQPLASADVCVLHHVCRPATCFSFLIAGVSALLSAFCISEFAVRYPFAGSSFNYLQVSLGELVAWLMGATMVMVYLLVSLAFSVCMCAKLSFPVAYITCQLGLLSCG